MAGERFSLIGQRVLASSFAAARELSQSCLCSEHLLVGILLQKGDDACLALENQGVTRGSIGSVLSQGKKEAAFSGYKAEISREAEGVLERAAFIAGFSDGGQIYPSHILLAILSCEDCCGRKLLVSEGINIKAVEAFLSCPPRPSPKKPRAREPRLLCQWGTDMTAKAAEGAYDPLVGRDQELERVMRILCRRKKANPALIGEAGVGKTAIAEGMACLIASGRVPAPLKNKRLFSVDMGSVVSGTKYRGEFEEKLRGIIGEASSDSDIILFIDELHTIVGAGAAEGAVDAGNILKPFLARGDLRIIGATTPEEYRKYIAKDPALERRFQPVEIKEPDREANLAILRSAAASCRRFYGIEAGEDIFSQVELMCRRFLPERHFPDKAIDVLDEAFASALTEGALRLRPDHVKKVVSQMSGYSALRRPCGFMGPEELEKELSEAVAGQDEAVRVTAMAAASAMAFPGCRDRPKSVMMFCGPPGVGKSLLAKKLACSLFGDEKALLRIDMSEYSEAHSVSRLIGAPPGYEGSDRGGLLTEAVRRRPFSVILFDEAEKAHGEVLNLLLQITEEGVLTDSEGRKADFRNTIVILTSNAGSGREKRAGFISGKKEEDRDALKGIFSAELLSRLDRIVSFDELVPSALEKIAHRELTAFKNRLAEDETDFIWDKEAERLLAENKKDGRAVRTAVREQVEQPLASMCHGGGLPPLVKLSVTDGRLRLFAAHRV